MKADRETFGPHLRVERERRGVTLQNIAASTKIKESLFVELERNDFSNWPQGIFRRSHLCAYLSAIGLPPQPILAEYLRLFPEEAPVDQAEDVEGNDAAVHHAERALTPKPSSPPRVDRAWIVCFDLATVCLVASILAAGVGLSLGAAIALTGLAYSAIGSVCFAQGIGSYVQPRLDALLQFRRQPRPLQTTLRDLERIAAIRTRRSVAEGETGQEHRADARRVSA